MKIAPLQGRGKAVILVLAGGVILVVLASVIVSTSAPIRPITHLKVWWQMRKLARAADPQKTWTHDVRPKLVKLGPAARPYLERYLTSRNEAQQAVAEMVLVYYIGDARSLPKLVAACVREQDMIRKGYLLSFIWNLSVRSGCLVDTASLEPTLGTILAQNADSMLSIYALRCIDRLDCGSVPKAKLIMTFLQQNPRTPEYKRFTLKYSRHFMDIFAVLSDGGAWPCLLEWQVACQEADMRSLLDWMVANLPNQAQETCAGCKEDNADKK